MHSRQPTSLVISRHYCLISFHSKMNCIKKFSRIVCVSLFSYQGYSLSALCDSLFRLSHSLTFVKNFFNLFSTSFPAVRLPPLSQTFVCLKRQLIKNITSSCVCQLLFYSFFQEQFPKISDYDPAFSAFP